MNYETKAAERDAADEQLDLLREQLQDYQYEGYPAQRDRLTADGVDGGIDPLRSVELPDGPWSVDAHSRQPVRETVPSQARQAELRDEGYLLDGLGRPLHPWFFRMVADPAIGVVLGKGTNWEWGANQTTEAVVVKNGHVLFVKRGDTGQWSLPGGYVNQGELPAAAAMRIAFLR